MAHLLLDMLFFISVIYVSIEITVITLFFQLGVGAYQGISEASKGRYLEAATSFILQGMRIHQLIPQLKLWQWQRQYGIQEITGELKQDASGFVYLDVPDEQLFSLAETFKSWGMELPPYFGKGGAGAHVSIMQANEWRTKGGRIREIGEKFTLRMGGVTSLKPGGWQGVKEVGFLILDSPQLETLRRNYGFSAKIQKTHDFHLTFGIKL